MGHVHKGTLDEVRVWNHSLSSSEINQSYMSNVEKYNSTQWVVYVNQSQTPSTGLSTGTYTYRLFATNSSGNTNFTLLRYLNIIAATSSAGTTSSSSGSGINKGYISEYITSEDRLNLMVSLPKNKTVKYNIQDDKKTGIKEIELKSTASVSGEVYVKSYNEIYNYSVQYDGKYLIYKFLDFNTTINDILESGRVRIGVSKNWIYSNNISEIKFLTCSGEEINSSFESETDNEGIYDVYISDFSDFTIIGTLEPASEKSEKIWNTEIEEDNYLWIFIIGGIIIIFIVFFNFRVELLKKLKKIFK